MGIETGRAFGMPLNDFIDLMWDQLQAGKDIINIGFAGTDEKRYYDLIDNRQLIFSDWAKAIMDSIPGVHLD